MLSANLPEKPAVIPVSFETGKGHALLQNMETIS